MGYWYSEANSGNTRFPNGRSKVWEWLFTVAFFGVVIVAFGWPWEARWDVWLLLAVASCAAERMTARAFARGDRLVEDSIYRVRGVHDPRLSHARYFPLLDMAIKDVTSRSREDLVIEWREIGHTGWNWQRMCLTAEEARALNSDSEFEKPRIIYLER